LFKKKSSIKNDLEFNYFEGTFQLYFQKSRDSMSFFLNHFSNKKNDKLTILIPSFYCWEILDFIDLNKTIILYYEIDVDYKPNWNWIKSKYEFSNIDIIVVVSFFGLPVEINKVRDFSNIYECKIFFDQTHSLYPNIKPRKEEFVFMSSYKQLPIPNGSITIIDYDSNIELINAYNLLKKKSTIINDTLWILKNFYVILTKRKKFLVNEYINKNNELNNAILLRKIYKGMSPISYAIMNIESNKFLNLNKTYDHLQIQIKNLLTNFDFELFNYDYKNSHLFGIRFPNPEITNKAYSVLKKNKLPVIIWPEKSFINNIPIEFHYNLKLKVDNILFICAFYNNLM
jgi:hypothetical protein